MPPLLLPLCAATLPMVLMALPVTMPVRLLLAVAVEVLKAFVMDDVAVEALLAAATPGPRPRASPMLLFCPVLLSLAMSCCATEFSLAWGAAPPWVVVVVAVWVMAPPVLPDGLVAVLVGLAKALAENASAMAVARIVCFIGTP